MKLRFEAIDGKGRVTRGVLRADSEEEARDLLMAEEIYPKRFEECPEDLAPTWAPKVRRQRGGQSLPDGERRAVRHCFETVLLAGGVAGKLGLSESGEAVVFETRDGEPQRFPIDDIEVSSVHGLLSRQFTITFNNGKTMVWEAGSIFRGTEAPALVRHIQSRKKN